MSLAFSVAYDFFSALEVGTFLQTISLCECSKYWMSCHLIDLLRGNNCCPQTAAVGGNQSGLG